MIRFPTFGSVYARLRQSLAILFLGRFLSSLATGLFNITLLWLAIESAHRVEELATVLILRLLPFVLFGLVGGWLGDTLDRRIVIIAGDFGRAVTILVSIMALSAGADILPVLAASGFLLTSLRSISSPAVRAIVPDLCGTRALHRANGFLEMIGYAVVMITPVLGGMALARFSHITVLAIIGFLFLGASLVSVALPLRRRARQRPSPPAADYRMLLAFMGRRRTGFLVFMGLNIVAVIAVSGAEALVIPAQTNTLFPKDPAFLGTILSLMAASAVGGALTAGLMRTWPQQFTVHVAWIAYALSLGTVSLVDGKSLLLVTVAFLGYTGAIIDTLITVMVQRTIARRHRAKLFGVISIALHMGDVTSLWLTAVVVSALGFATTLQIAAGITMAVAAAGLMSVRPEGSRRGS